MHLDPWTLGLQAANFLVLVWLLQRFVYRPVLRVIDARTEATRKLTTDLEAKAAAAAKLQADLEAQRAGTARARDEALRTARGDAEAERKAMLDKARAEADAMKAEAKAVFERERDEAARTLGRDAARLAVSIVRRLLQEGAGAAVQADAVDRICQDIRSLPADARQRIVERLESDGRPPEVVTAVPLDEPAAKRISEGLAGLHASADPVFRVDPALLAGVEVHFPFTILRRTWADALARIGSELDHDDAAAKLA